MFKAKQLNSLSSARPGGLRRRIKGALLKQLRWWKEESHEWVIFWRKFKYFSSINICPSSFNRASIIHDQLYLIPTCHSEFCSSFSDFAFLILRFCARERQKRANWRHRRQPPGSASRLFFGDFEHILTSHDNYQF